MHGRTYVQGFATACWSLTSKTSNKCHQKSQKAEVLHDGGVSRMLMLSTKDNTEEQTVHSRFT